MPIHSLLKDSSGNRLSKLKLICRRLLNLYLLSSLQSNRICLICCSGIICFMSLGSRSSLSLSRNNSNIISIICIIIIIIMVMVTGIIIIIIIIRIIRIIRIIIKYLIKI